MAPPRRTASVDPASDRTEVYLELGSKRVFACSLSWPGWCRSGRDEDQALGALAEYAPRYGPVVRRAGYPLGASAGDLVVTERIAGSATTDFGAPGSIPSGDGDPLTSSEATRLAAIVGVAWQVFDEVAASAPAVLQKGPRGGGRDRDAVTEHLVGADLAYARKIGVRRTAASMGDVGAIGSFREEVLAVIASARAGDEAVVRGWPIRYAARRFAWHALDHAWEIEDRSPA